MIEEKLQSASMSLKERVAHLTAHTPRDEEPAAEVEEQPSDVAMTGDEDTHHVTDTHVSDSNDNDKHVIKDEEERPVFFNFL